MDFVQIEVRPEAAEPVRFAAEELSRYLTRATGTEAEVSEGDGQFLVAAVDDGEAPTAVAERLSGHGPEAFAVGTVGEQLVLLGNSPRATVYAVYHFLEKYVGCRWYTPDPEEELVPEMSAADVTALIARGIADLEEPDFSVRMRRYLVYDLGPAGTPLADEVMGKLAQVVAWMPKLRLNILQFGLDHNWDCYTKWDGYRAVMPELRRRGLEVGVGGHCMHMFVTEQDLEEHPEWKISTDGDGHKREQFCTRQPAAVKHYLAGLVAFLKANPEITYFAPWPNDVAGWCSCPRCADTAVPDRYIEVGNQIFTRLAEEVPHVRVTHFAYGRHVELPEHELPLEGMTITVSPWGRDFAVPFDDPRTSETFRSNVAKWRQVCAQRGCSMILHEKYARHLLLGVHLLPLPVLAEDLQFFRKEGLDGFELPCAYMGWWPKSLNWIALGRLMWDADADLRELTDDFFATFYGPCAQEAADIYALVEAGQNDYHYWIDSPLLEGKRHMEPGKTPSAELVAYAERAADYLGQAKAAIEALRGQYAEDCALSRRLDHLHTTVDYAFHEFSALREIVRGALAAANGELDAAFQHFQAAGQFNLTVQQYASRPEDYGVLWDIAASGPSSVYQSSLIAEWLRLIEERRRDAGW